MAHQNVVPAAGFSMEPKRHWFIEILKIIAGIVCIAGVIFFVYLATNGADHLPAKENIIKTPLGNKNIDVYSYVRGGIKYLVFYCNGNIQTVNYTADSLRLQEYLDYQQMVKDTTGD